MDDKRTEEEEAESVTIPTLTIPKDLFPGLCSEYQKTPTDSIKKVLVVA